MSNNNANFGIPEWVVRILPPGEEPTQISDDDLLKLNSYLAQHGRRIMTLPGPEGDDARGYNSLRERLVTLQKYNQALRENLGPHQMLPPTMVEQAIAQGYVDCRVIVTVLPIQFADLSILTKYLHVRTDKIRQFKPRRNRRMVHAADLLKCLYDEENSASDAKLQAHGEQKQRRNKPGK